jgi:hypothetical protein
VPGGSEFVDFRRLNVQYKFTSITFSFVSIVTSSLHRRVVSHLVRNTLIVALPELGYCSVVLHSIAEFVHVSL